MTEPAKRKKVTPFGLLQVWLLFVAVTLTGASIAIALGAISPPPAQARNITIVAVMSCISAIASLTKRDER